MKKIMFYAVMMTVIASCGPKKAATRTGADNQIKYDPKRGTGKFTHITIPQTIDTSMVASGKAVFQAKCFNCHKLTDEKLVGPGWAGLSKKFSAEWVMNFVTNTDEMLEQDPNAKAQLEVCLVRMPNQFVNDADARALYEFMRNNDKK